MTEGVSILGSAHPHLRVHPPHRSPPAPTWHGLPPEGTTRIGVVGHLPEVLREFGVAFVDGNHSLENVKYDFLEILRRSKTNTYIFLHDTNIYIREMVRNSGVKRWLKRVRRETEIFETIDFPFSSGVALVRVLQDDAWKYLER